MLAQVIWNGSGRLVLTDLRFVESFVIDATLASLGKVTLARPITNPQLVRVFALGWGELRSNIISNKPNYRIDNSDIIFDELGLYGLSPRIGTELEVSYQSANLEDILRENPEIKMTSSYDNVTQDLKISIWLHETGQVTAATSCDVYLTDFGTSLGNSLGEVPNGDGVFNITLPSLNLTLVGTYAIKAVIVTPTKTYTQIIALDIGGTNTTDIVEALLLACAQDGLPNRIFVYDPANPTKPQRIVEMHSNGIIKRRDFVYNVDNVPVTETVTDGP